jgi:hypothetical protein
MITATGSEPGPGGVGPGAVIRAGSADRGGGGQGQHRVSLGHGSPDARGGLAVSLAEQPVRLGGQFLGPAVVLRSRHSYSTCLILTPDVMQRMSVNFLQWHARHGDRARHLLRPDQHGRMTGPDAGQDVFQTARRVRETSRSGYLAWAHEDAGIMGATARPGAPPGALAPPLGARPRRRRAGTRPRACSRRGRRSAGSRRLALWRLGEDGLAPIGDPQPGHERSSVLAVAVGQLGGQSVAVTGGDDGTVRLWRKGTSGLISIPTAHIPAGSPPIRITLFPPAGVLVWCRDGVLMAEIRTSRA